MDTPPKTNINPKLNFSSEFFDSQEVLEAGDITLPFLNVTPYKNLSGCNSIVFNKIKRPINNASKSGDVFCNDTAVQNGNRQPASQGNTNEILKGNSVCDDDEKKRFSFRTNKNKHKENDIYYVRRRGRKSGSSYDDSDNTDIGRKAHYANCVRPNRKSNERETEKPRKDLSEVSSLKNPITENRDCEAEKRSSDFCKQQEKCKPSASSPKFNAPPGALNFLIKKLDLAGLCRIANGTNKKGKTGHSSDEFVPKIPANENDNYDANQQEEVDVEERKKIMSSASKAGAPEVNQSASELQVSSEITGENETENSRKNNSSGSSSGLSLTCDMDQLQFSGESNEKETNQSSGNFTSRNAGEYKKDESYGISNREEKSLKNNTTSRGEVNHSVSDPVKLQGFVDQTSKVKRRNKANCNSSMVYNEESSENSNFNRMFKNSVSHQEKFGLSGSRDEFFLGTQDPDQQHGLLDEINNRILEMRSKGCSGASTSRNLTSRNAYKLDHYRKRKPERELKCAKHHNSFEIGESSHCHSKSSESTCDPHSRDKNKRSHLNCDGDREDYAKSVGDCYGNSKHHHQCCSKDDENYRRVSYTSCDHSRPDETGNDRLRYDRRHCDHSRPDETGNDRLRYDRRHCDHSRPDETDHDRSRYDRRHRDHSRPDETDQDRSRFDRRHCDHSRIDETDYDRSRYDRRHYDYMSHNRYGHDRFRDDGRFPYHSNYGKYRRSYRDRLDYERNRPMFDGNRHGSFRYGGNHREFHCSPYDHPRRWENHENEGKGRKEVKEKMFDEYECCHWKCDKYDAKPQTRTHKPEDMLDQENSGYNNVSIGENMLKEHERRSDYDDGELLPDSESEFVMDSATMKSPTGDGNFEKSDNLIDEQIKIGEDILNDRKRNQNQHEKSNLCVNTCSVNDAEICNVSKLAGEVSSEELCRYDERRSESKRVEEINKTHYGNHNLGKSEISKECKDNVQSIGGNRNTYDASEDYSEAVNISVVKPVRHTSGERQANLLHSTGFSMKAASQSTVTEESCNTIGGTSKTPTVAADFFRLQCSSRQLKYLESTPNTLPYDNKINQRENPGDPGCFRNIFGEEADQDDRDSEFEERLSQNRSGEENIDNRNSEFKILHGTGNSEVITEVEQPLESKEGLPERFQVTDSDSLGNCLSNKEGEDRNVEERYDIRHAGLGRKCTESHHVGLKVSQDYIIGNQTECAGVSNDLFGSKAGEDCCNDEKDKHPAQSQNTSNAQLQTQGNANTVSSDLIGSLLYEDNGADELELTQLENSDLEDRRYGPSDKSFQGADSDEAMSDDGLEEDVGGFETTLDQSKDVVECSKNLNYELQRQHDENVTGNPGVTEHLKNCEITTNQKNFWSEVSDFPNSVPDKEVQYCVDEPQCQSENLGSLHNQDERLPDLDNMRNPEISECLHENAGKVANNGDSEKTLSVKESVTPHESEQKNDCDVICQNTKLLKENSTNDCVCKCHKHCGGNEINSKRVMIIRTCHDKSTQVNFDTGENYDDAIDVNITHVKLILSGDYASTTEDDKDFFLSVSAFLAKCRQTGVRNPTAEKEGEENTGSEKAEECRRKFVEPLEANKHKGETENFSETVALVHETQTKRRRIENSKFFFENE